MGENVRVEERGCGRQERVLKVGNSESQHWLTLRPQARSISPPGNVVDGYVSEVRNRRGGNMRRVE